MKKINTKEILEGLKIITRHPNRNWRKVFIVLALLALISLVWNIFFFFEVRSAIMQADISSSLPFVSGDAKDSEISKTLKMYEEKKARFEKLYNNRPEVLEDPAVS